MKNEPQFRKIWYPCFFRKAISGNGIIQISPSNPKENKGINRYCSARFPGCWLIASNSAKYRSTRRSGASSFVAFLAFPASDFFLPLVPLTVFLLFRKCHRSRFADDGHFDLSRISHFGLDTVRNISGQQFSLGI